ncbi:MAG: ATP cone domain-containing protein [Nitrosopumilaceae archaeon]
MKKIYIIKANGQSVPFDPNKVIGTCIRAGASNKMAKRIARKTLKMIRSGMSTKDIYRIVLRNISEIDVIAKLNNKRYMVECKYHHRRGIYTGLKDSLYTHARFLDLNNQFDEEILSCNTRLSVDALTYAKCVGQNILCWRRPQGGGLEKMIDEKGLYTITMLNLNKMELMAFSKINFMIAKDLLTTNLNQLSQKTNIPYPRLQGLQNLVRQILA